jgi:TetR/AcrR family transcriptional regulator, tetracycline repressor protein
LSTVPPKTASRPALSREVVADRALDIADAEGIEAVTIRRLATELGVTPMALYWHFRTKEDLLAGLADRVLDGLELPGRGDDWADDIRAAMRALVTAMRPHPQVAYLIPARVMQHPKGLDLTELALQTLSDAGFTTRQAGQLAMQAMRAVVGMVTSEPVDDSGRSAEQRDAELRTKRAHLTSLPPERYPRLVEHADAMTYCPDVDEFFDFGIDFYVAGVRGLAPSSRG